MKSYDILDAESSETLALKVREAIDQGMVPIGGMTAQTETFHQKQWFYQAACDPTLLQPAKEAK